MMRAHTVTLKQAVLFGGLLMTLSFSTFAQRALNSCSGLPKFVSNIGLQQPIVIDTKISTLPGVVIRELQGKRRVYQQKGWSQTGHVGPTVRDRDGSIYVISVPSIGLDTNPLERRNHVYKIDSVTGEISVFAKLPMPKQLSQRNPFGTLGLALDCASNTLFVSSVAGSTPTNLHGVIYQLSIKTGEILDQYEGIDALGLELRSTATDKFLYFGNARSSNLQALKLKPDGNFYKGQAPVKVLSLLEQKNGDSTQIRKIRFMRLPDGSDSMVLTETEFAYRMATGTSRAYRTYHFTSAHDDPQTELEEWRLTRIIAR